MPHAAAERPTYQRLWANPNGSGGADGGGRRGRAGRRRLGRRRRRGRVGRSGLALQQGDRLLELPASLFGLGLVRREVRWVLGERGVRFVEEPVGVGEQLARGLVGGRVLPRRGGR